MDILFAENSKRKCLELKPETVKDLAIQELVDNITENETEMLTVREIFTKIPLDVEDMKFRQDILRDFMENDELAEGMKEAIGLIKTLSDYGGMKVMRVQNESTLYVLLENLRELSVYVNVSEILAKSLGACDIRSEGLKKLRASMQQIVGDEKFKLAKKDIDKMMNDLSVVKGAIVGVNFTPDLNVESVAAVDFVPYRIKSQYVFAEMAAFIHNVLGNAQSTNSIGSPAINTYVVDPLLVTMTPQIEKHLKRHFVRMKSIMSKYVMLDGGSLTEMYEGLIYYTVMARLSKRMKCLGCEICMPELISDERSFCINDLYNIRLVFAGEKNIVKNDFSFTPKENLYILTGPNRGGKTIIEQAMGIISIMASIGSFVTASKCSGRPFANILTHFPIDENLTINYGRLGEEAVRIKEIVKEADDRTLILFNETYSTTSAADGLYLSKDLLRVLKERGVAAIFNTHIHEVARAIDEMNEWEGESDLISIVMEIKNNENTFRVKRSEPESKSYARNIAEKYGITYEQMKDS